MSLLKVSGVHLPDTRPRHLGRAARRRPRPKHPGRRLVLLPAPVQDDSGLGDDGSPSTVPAAARLLPRDTNMYGVVRGRRLLLSTSRPSPAVSAAVWISFIIC